MNRGVGLVRIEANEYRMREMVCQAREYKNRIFDDGRERLVFYD